MLLVGRYGTTKQLVRSPAFRRKHISPFNQHFTTVFPRFGDEASRAEQDPPTASAQHDKSYAVLGGGITGLSAAYFLTRKFPNAQVNVYEASKRLGGWAESEKVEVDGGHVLFEWGPRSLRPDLSGPGKITAQLIHSLGLEEEIVATHRHHVAAHNRFVYYPDHLVRMPGPYPHAGILTNLFRNLPTLLTEPIFKGVIGGMLAEPTVKTRPTHMEDESVGDFVRRRFGPSIADNMLSALFHGIYAGDIYKLSARTLLPKLWYLETRDPDGAGIIPELFELMFKNEQVYSSGDARILTEGGFTELEGKHIASLYQHLAQQSVYTFVDGIGQLASRLGDELLEMPNVRIATGSPVLAVGSSESGQISITSRGDVTGQYYDYVISTLSPTAMGDDPTSNPFLGSPEIRDAATVMVVNLYYSNPNLTDPYRGFGYLIPQSVPLEQNPERALGVIFASETSGPRGPNLDNQSESSEALEDNFQTTSALSAQWATNHQDTAPGTKLTVMLGGHWWTDWAWSDIPSPETAIEMAKSALARHMGISEEPLIAKAKLQKDAIPQYRVGHRKSMARVHLDLEKFQGRLRMAGPAWQGGVGVNDCIRRAWEIVDELAEGDGRLLGSAGGRKTGLEHFGQDQDWVTIERKGGKVLIKEGSN